MLEGNIRMRPEEGEEGPQLIHLDEQVVSGRPRKPRDVRAAERHPTQAQLEELVDRALDFALDRQVVSSPEGSKLLGSQKETSSQDEGSPALIVTSEYAPVGTPLLEGAVGIMNVAVLKYPPISLSMDRVKG